MRLARLAVTLLLAAPGCGAADGTKFEPSSEATRVSGVLVRSVQHPPDDLSTVEIPVMVAPGKVEGIRIPSRTPGQRPTDLYVELYRKSMSMTPGDLVAATGTRDARGILIVEKLEVKRR